MKNTKTIRTWGKGAAIALGMALGIGLAQGQEPARGGPPPVIGPATFARGPALDNVQIQAVKVQGNVWMLSGGGYNAAISVGDDGVLVVDTMLPQLADKFLAKVKEVGGNRPIRIIVNTHSHGDHTGGNVALAATQTGDRKIQIIAHANTAKRMGEGPQAIASSGLPNDPVTGEEKTITFNNEQVVIRHQPNGHTNGDLTVFFRRSNVIVTGDVYTNLIFPMFFAQQGGTYQGSIDTLNNLIDYAVPKQNGQEGTLIIPGHGTVAEEPELIQMREMNRVIRTRILDAIRQGQTLEQVKAANPVREYADRYGTSQGGPTTESFIERAYETLKGSAAPTAR